MLPCVQWKVGSRPCPGWFFLELGKMFPRLKQHFPSRSFLRLKRTWSLVYLLDATMCQYWGTFSLKIHVAPVPRADPVRFWGRGPRSG